MTHTDKLALAVWEADRHAFALVDALTEWNGMSIFSLAQIEADRMLVRLSDQVLFRFTKLQDALGERLVPATLQHLAEPFEDWSMRDRLNRLAHEYPDQPELRFATVRAAVVAAQELVAAYRAWKSLL